MKCGFIAGEDFLEKVRRGASPFCDKPATRGSYCSEHAALCLRGIPKRAPRDRYQHEGTGRWRGKSRAPDRLASVSSYQLEEWSS